MAQSINRLERQLRALTERGLRFAMADAANELAFKVRPVAIANMRERFTLRNNWSAGSVRVVKATLRTLAASVGTPRQYLRAQEEGDTKRGEVPMPTPAAAGQQGNRRAKVVRKVNRMTNINPIRIAGRLSGARAVAAVMGNMGKVIEADIGGGPAIYRVQGVRRDRVNVVMLYSLRRTSQTVRPAQWLRPAALSAYDANVYAKHLSRQIERALSR